MTDLDLSGFTEEERYEIEAELHDGYADIEKEHGVDSQKGFDNVIVVDNVPIVDEAKKEKLIMRLCQLFQKAGAPIDEDRVDMPWDDKAATSKGFVFLSYPDAAQAEHALSAIDGSKFGKSELYVNRFGDIERYANMTVGDDELPPGWKERPYNEKDHARSWLGDAAGRDQYLTFRDNLVSMFWNGRNFQEEPVKTPDGKNLTNPLWGQYYVQWSPLGTYLATIHLPGVALWSGSKLDNMLRVTHPDVRLIQFSPCENYLVTWSPEPLNVANPSPKVEKAVRDTFGPEDEGAQFVIWDVKTARMMRTFAGEKPDENGPRERKWPVFKWSPDDAYVARCVPNEAIQVYELPDMGLLDRKSIKIEGVQDFEWCPMGDKDWEDRKANKQPKRECMLAYWTPEAQNQPARVNLMAIPSRNVLRSKNLFNVTDCKFAFQNQGDYLCVKVDRHARKAKNKKATFCNLELFRLREKDFPVEVIEHKEYVTSFAWEPNGQRFAIVSTSDPNFGQNIPGVVIKYNVSFYEPDPKKGDFTPFKVLEGKVCNTLIWSPRGRNVVLATVGSPTKFDIEFLDVDFTLDDTPGKIKDVENRGDYVQSLSTGEHYGITDIAWDPSGRFLASWASSWNSTPEPGFMLWDFKGQNLGHQGQDKFKQFLWRPRPPTLLSKSDRRKIRKDLKEFSRVFEEEDAAAINAGTAEVLAARQRAIAEWDAWRARNNAALLAERQARHKLIVKPWTKEGAAEKVEEVFEELIDETETIE
ncbi:hypothetical protein CspeluHIS016_0404640 [Cutaneotrichosporon spelunceum]|uniref:Eukaryotic translation initiation factor 3 subunit B n=1 Tax=Cutaneotrichosporon spelunceum TaxID=1672016 RepID=A0AAD3TVH1_9TREE|nr:hypothetical protein CspeluHIS016_0404640 [Cutaneotrichosporon spelunceum]